MDIDNMPRMLNEYMATRDRMSKDAHESSGIMNPESKTSRMLRFVEMTNRFAATLHAELEYPTIAELQHLSTLALKHVEGTGIFVIHPELHLSISQIHAVSELCASRAAELRKLAQGSN